MNGNRMQAFALCVAKCLEIAHWLTVAVMAGLLVCVGVAKQWLCQSIERGVLFFDPEVTVYGFNILLTDTNGTVNMDAAVLFLLEAVIALSLMAMVFRNVRLILKTVGGTNPHTRRTTPFQADVVRMLREIGIFFLSVSVVGFVFSTIGRLILGPETAEISVGLDCCIMGLFVLCLTQAFSYGIQLETDMEGLV